MNKKNGWKKWAESKNERYLFCQYVLLLKQTIDDHTAAYSYNDFSSITQKIAYIFKGHVLCFRRVDQIWSYSTR